MLSPQQLIALGLALKVERLLKDGARVGNFGILVTSLPDFDVTYFIQQMGKLRNEGTSVRLAFKDVASDALLFEAAASAGFTLDQDFAVDLFAAGRWRNDPTIVDAPIAIARGEQPTLHTLAAFTKITSADIAVELLDWAKSEDHVAANVQHTQLLQALASEEFAQLHNPLNVADYLSGLLNLKPIERLEAIKNYLPYLGLLRDPEIFSVKGGIQARLKDNLNYCQQIRSLQKSKQTEIRNRLEKFPEDKRIELGNILTLVQSYQRTFSFSEFQQLTLPQVRDLMNLKPVKGKSKPSIPEDPQSDEPNVAEVSDIIAVGDEDSLHRAFAEALISADSGARDNIARAVEESLEEAIEEATKTDQPFVVVSAGEAELEARIAKDDKLLEFVHAFCSEHCWGGIYDTEHGTLRAAIDLFNHEKYCLDPDEPVDTEENSVVTYLQGLDDHMGLQGQLISAFRHFEATRKTLLPLIDSIVLAPLETIGASPERFQLFEQYIDASNKLLLVLKENYEALREISEEGLEVCVSYLLAMDTVLVRARIDDKDINKAILMPLHPLHLWKFVRLIQIYQRQVQYEDLHQADREAIIAEASSKRHFLHTLFLSEMLTGDKNIDLPFAGSIGTLPCYENTSNHYSGSDGLKSLFHTLERFIAFYPLFVRPLRLSIVDVPSVTELLAETARFLTNVAASRLPSLDMQLFFTEESSSRNYLVSLTTGENERVYQEFVASGRLNLSIHSNPVTLNAVQKEHKQRPVHVIALFDQSDLDVRDFRRQQFFTVDSPLCITYEFDYDFIKDVFNSHPVNDAEVFSHYIDLRNRLRGRLSNHSPGVISKTQKLREQLDQLLQTNCTQWLFIADRILPAENRLSSPRIHARHEGRREVLVLASTSEHFARELSLLLKQYNFYPERKQIEQLLLDFSHMVSDGLLSIIQAKDGTLMENKSLGLIGLLVAARAYIQENPNSLIVSVDSQDARRWLRVTDANRRADLIGVRANSEGEFIIEAIEVKTFVDQAEVFSRRNGGIEGKAVEQVISIKEALESAFAELNSPLTPPRREVLRDLLYVECEGRHHTKEFRQQWAASLNQLFTPGARVSVGARIYQIDLRHEQSGVAEILHVEGIDSRIPVTFIALGERQVQKLLAGIDLDPTPPVWPGEPDFPDDGPDSLPDSDDGAPKLPSGERSDMPRTAPNVGKGMERAEQGSDSAIDTAWLQKVRDAFVRACSYYNVQVVHCDIDEAIVGFSVIRFPFRLARGTKRERLERSLEDIGREIAISNLMVQSLPNSQNLVLDVPNPHRRTPHYVVDGWPSVPSIDHKHELPLAIGVKPSGEIEIANLRNLVHLLVGGTTGAGKTVFLYSVIASLLWTHQQEDDLELVLSSSKLEDFAFFFGLSQLHGRNILTDADATIAAIGDIANYVLQERSELLAHHRVRSIEEFNQTVDWSRQVRPIVIIVDEFADLADQVGRDKEARAALYTNIRRIAQAGRSRSVHLVLCTQRPTADLFPSNIKTLMNARVAFRMNSHADSRTILDDSGAENLTGSGDMLFKWNGTTERLQGFYIEPDDILSDLH